MKILSIETSCDETAISAIQIERNNNKVGFAVLGDALFSQAKLHAEYGGVVPSLARREHNKNLPVLLKSVLKDAGWYKREGERLDEDVKNNIKEMLSRQSGLYENTIELLDGVETPPINVIAVTEGPGLSPALWTGVLFAKTLAYIWDIPIIPVNHMEGHIVASLADGNKLHLPSFPLLALLVSGGHTEMVLMDGWGSFKKVGETRDDAVGEVFDKVGRLLSLEYPAGPQIGMLAKKGRESGRPDRFSFPRPMSKDPSLDFSFSGLKTAVRYTVKDLKTLTEEDREDIARSFEDAVTESLLIKLKKSTRHV